MITIKKEIKKQQNNFWNNCLFHPTDAIEDPWGKKILDRIARDKSIETIRIYTMFEDIVYLDENDNLAYDFRLNDLRLDYLVQKGFNLLLAYGMMPECIAVNKNATSCVSKNKTRYKGKLINTSIPTDYKLWEDICYTYTKHFIERYGIDVVSEWYLQCFNEPDISAFFISDIPRENTDIRAKEYCKLYTAFANGIQKASGKVRFGGPALACKHDFLTIFLDYVYENNIRLDFISLHNYAGTSPQTLNEKNKGFSVDDWINKQTEYLNIIKKHGFSETKIIIDEWGMSCMGFHNIEECPYLIARENEIFSAYFIKLIYKIIEKEWNISKLMICLSGQHEMVVDFSGFRNFFTLNFFAKPIYNAYVLSSKLHKNLLSFQTMNKNLFVIPTINDTGDYSVLLTYSSENFNEELPEIIEELLFEENIKDKKITVFCIDKKTTNPYRLHEKMNTAKISDKEIKKLRNEGNLTPIAQFISNGYDKIKLRLTANSVFLITVTENQSDL